MVTKNLEIVSVNPLERADDIKELFRAHARPEFPEFFDRAYPIAAARGALSWVGLDSRGAVVMHYARFTRRFQLNGDEVVGGLLVNMMVAEGHRTFIPAAKLLARVVEDSTRESAIDFLYADPNERGRAVGLTFGFVTIGHLNRFVLPVSARGPLDLGIRAYHWARRRRRGRGAWNLVVHAAVDFDAAPYERSPGRSGRLLSNRGSSLFAERLVGYPAAADQWLAFRQKDGGSGPRMLLLARGPAESGRVQLHAVWRDPAVPLAPTVGPLLRWLRTVGARKVEAVALEESPLGRDLGHAGFFARGPRVPVLALALTDRGRLAVQAAPAWDLMGVDCDR
jgi:hypothetical protein